MSTGEINMRGKIWIDDMSEYDRALAFKAVQKLDRFYCRRTVDQYKCFYLRSGIDVWNDVSIDCYRESELPEITLQQLLKLAGMENNMTTKQFSKKDLVAGKHVVETENGRKYLIACSINKPLYGLNLNGSSYMCLATHNEDLTYGSNLSVVAVYEIHAEHGFHELSRELKLIWKREERSATQIELEKLQQQIADLQDQANKLQQTL